MTAPPPAVSATRVAVRRILSTVDGLVLVACSGGADSLALAAATAFEAPRCGLSAGLVTVDHGLQEGSAERAAKVAAWGGEVGLAPIAVVPVVVVGRRGGPEAAARQARYEALAAAAVRVGASAVLLGHTLDDQAETVLLALARGGGPRGLAGMPSRREVHGVAFLRPFLTVRRERTRTACADLGLPVWDDPHNVDPAYSRSRLRSALGILAETLGPDLVDNLARTARLMADDVIALDSLASAAALSLTDPDGSLSVAGLAELPAALRTRLLRLLALRSGAPAAALSSVHIDALNALVAGWHGQGPVALPGGHRVARRGDRLVALPGRPVS